MKAAIFFADARVKAAFEALQTSTHKEDQELAGLLDRAFAAIAANAFCGIQVAKRQIPKVYLQRYPPITNLWKYNLSRSGRLMYTVASDGDTIAVIIEWLDHTDYGSSVRVLSNSIPVNLFERRPALSHPLNA